MTKTTTKEMNITEEEFDMELMDSLPDPVPSRPPGFGVAVREYALKKGCSIRLARDILDRLVEGGELFKKEMRMGSKSGYIYFKEDV